MNAWKKAQPTEMQESDDMTLDYIEALWAAEREPSETEMYRSVRWLIRHYKEARAELRRFPELIEAYLADQDSQAAWDALSDAVERAKE